MTCFLCLEGTLEGTDDVLIPSCAPDTCHNLMAHEHCLVEAYANGVTSCSICNTPYPVIRTSERPLRCKSPTLAATLSLIIGILCAAVAALMASLTAALASIPPDGLALMCCIIFVALMLTLLQLRLACDLCLERPIVWTTRLAV